MPGQWRGTGAPGEPAEYGPTAQVLRVLFERAPEIITVTDGEGRQLLVNPTAQRLLGITAPGDAPYDGWRHIHPDDIPALLAVGQHFRSRAFPAEPPRAVRCRVRDVSGRWRWLEMVMADLRDVPEVRGLVVSAATSPRPSSGRRPCGSRGRGWTRSWRACGLARWSRTPRGPSFLPTTCCWRRVRVLLARPPAPGGEVRSAVPAHAAHGSSRPGEPRPRILVVDDDPDIRTILEGVLGRAGMDVIAADGRQALRLLFDQRPDVVVLDLGLPDLDGFEVLRRVRDLTDAPVLVLTARGLEADKLKGFGLGADDYVTKPFSNAELAARLHAALRRAGPDSGRSHLLTDEPLAIDLRAKIARLSGRQVYLSPIDWNLLVTFVRHKGQVLSLEQLLEHAWSDPCGVSTERVKFATLRLRRRMGWQDPATSPIEAVRGFGYRYRGLHGS